MTNDSQMMSIKLPSKFNLTPKIAIGILVFIGTTGVTAFWQYSDARNILIFLPRSEYEEKRNFDKAIAEKDREIILEKLEEIKRSQIEMKQLIKERSM